MRPLRRGVARLARMAGRWAPLALAACFLAAAPHAQPAAPHGASALADPVDPAAMSPVEIRAVQTFLAFEGHYVHLIDGVWGPASARAMEAFSRAQYDASPTAFHLATLVLKHADMYVDDGWSVVFLPDYGVSLLSPSRAVRPAAATGSFENWQHTRSSLAYAFARGDGALSADFHDAVAARSGPGDPDLYTVRRDGLAVTSVRPRAGGFLYARSDFISGAWTTVILSADAGDVTLGRAVAGSIATGRQPDMAIPAGGYLDRLVTLFLAVADGGAYPPVEGEAARLPRVTGSGFVITDTGTVLTNAHVVRDCARPRVDGEPARIDAASDAFDLALLHAPGKAGGPVARFAARPAELNADVTIAGYPLAGILAGLNVTRGSVSSLEGLLGDETDIQISAPVQPGNSGGPVFDGAGNVIGVVVARLDKRFTEETAGALPENVNFAVTGEIAKAFLAQNGVPITMSDGARQVSGAELGRLAAAVTVRVDCD